jgi:hypothetical protein
MTSTEQRSTSVLPTPRTGSADDAPDAAARELGQVGRRTRPRQYYWDVTTAAWRTRSTPAG